MLITVSDVVKQLTNVERFAIVRRMQSTISDKWQVVIPKSIRREMDIQPGQMVTVKRVNATTVTFERQPTMKELIEKSSGIMKTAPWQLEGTDPAVWLRKERDKE